MASEYVAAMRTVQPEGPSCLGSLCNGAHVVERVVLELELRLRVTKSGYLLLSILGSCRTASGGGNGASPASSSGCGR